MEGDNAELTLKFGYGKEITHEEKISISAKDTLKRKFLYRKNFCSKENFRIRFMLQTK